MTVPTAMTAIQTIAEALDRGRVEIIVHLPPAESHDPNYVGGISFGTELVVKSPRGYLVTIGMSRSELLRIRAQIDAVLGEVPPS